MTVHTKQTVVKWVIPTETAGNDRDQLYRISRVSVIPIIMLSANLANNLLNKMWVFCHFC